MIEPTAVGGPSDAIIGPSRRLGSDMRSRYAEATAIPPSTYAGHDGIDVRGDLGGLNLSFVPKVFIECGNMRNSVEAHLLEDPSFRERAAEGIVGGIVAFLHGL